MTDALRANIHTVWHRAWWINVREGSDQPLSHHVWKPEATARGREIATADGVEHVIHHKDHSVQRRDDYRRADPAPSVYLQVIERKYSIPSTPPPAETPPGEPYLALAGSGPESTPVFRVRPEGEALMRANADGSRGRGTLDVGDTVWLDLRDFHGDAVQATVRALHRDKITIEVDFDRVDDRPNTPIVRRGQILVVPERAIARARSNPPASHPDIAQRNEDFSCAKAPASAWNVTPLRVFKGVLPPDSSTVPGRANEEIHGTTALMRYLAVVRDRGDVDAIVACAAGEFVLIGRLVAQQNHLHVEEAENASVWKQRFREQSAGRTG